jgi:Kdo2-lipid IVA lauroyltransferase/acyltransferase
VVERGGGRLARDWSEGVFTRPAFAFFRLLPLDRASALCGAIACAVGPRLGVSKLARVNLRRALPRLSVEEIERIIAGMWGNLGRVVAEYPHLGEFDVYGGMDRVEVAGFPQILARHAPDKRYIFFSGHYGNWEIATLAVTQAGLEAIEIYRAANNPYVNDLINEARNVVRSDLVPKGKVAARRAIGGLAEGKHVCMLVDQKMNDGIAVPFFGRLAMTAPALARLALRFDCIVVPVQVDRRDGARFRITAEEPIPLPRSGDVQADTLALMTAVNATLERWIRARPEQWLWLHRRWPD